MRQLQSLGVAMAGLALAGATAGTAIDSLKLESFRPSRDDKPDPARRAENSRLAARDGTPHKHARANARRAAQLAAIAARRNIGAR